MFLRVIFLENCKMTVPYNSMQNNINFKHLSKVGFLVLFSNFTVDGICIIINEAVLVFFLQGSEVFISFIFTLESVTNSWKSFIPKNARNNFPNLWSRLSESRLSFIGSCSPLPIGVRKDGGGWESLPFYSCWRTGVTGS